MTEAPKHPKRHPIKNFFIKKDLQLRYIMKIIGAVTITAIITLAVLATVYYYKSGSGYFYFMSNDLAQDLQRQSILATILPSLIIAELISILIGIILGFFSSRKFAVPIYKIEIWATNLLKGNFGSEIIFREKDEFKTLTEQCNALSSLLRNKYAEVTGDLMELEKESSPAAKTKIAEILKKMPGNRG